MGLKYNNPISVSADNDALFYLDLHITGRHISPSENKYG